MLTARFTKVDGIISEKPYKDEIEAAAAEIEAIFAKHRCSYSEARLILTKVADNLHDEESKILKRLPIQKLRSIASKTTEADD